jgi:protein-S-isoprenylcysteine O-methyltransferase Ste14
LRRILGDPIEATIALAWVAFLLHWGVSAIRTKSTTKNRNVVVIVLMTFALVALFLLLRYLATVEVINLKLWHRTLPFAIVSVGIVLTGLFVLIWARQTLGSNWSATAETTEGQEIVQVGPYRHIRHPIRRLLGNGTRVSYCIRAFARSIDFGSVHCRLLHESEAGGIDTEKDSWPYI